MDIYICMHGARVVGASARLQGAELMRAAAAGPVADRMVRKLIEQRMGIVGSASVSDDEMRALDVWKSEERIAYEGMTIVNTELQDCD